MAIPEEDRLPPENRHAYGNYSHLSANGAYWFEWTPFTPAIVAWQNAARYLRSARDHLVDARQLKGFALAGLEDDHLRMIQSLVVFGADIDASAKAADDVADALQTANAAYAQSSDASAAEYHRLVALLDATLAGQGSARSTAQSAEARGEADRDRAAGAPFDPPPSPPKPAPLVTTTPSPPRK